MWSLLVFLFSGGCSEYPPEFFYLSFTFSLLLSREDQSCEWGGDTSSFDEVWSIPNMFDLSVDCLNTFQQNDNKNIFKRR